MARIRSVKPDFWEDEKVGALPRDARLLWIAIWTHSDDAGRFRADPRLLARQAFPYDADAGEVVTCGLAALAQAGLVRLYSVAGQAYGDTPNFLRHQRINKPQPPKFPAFQEDSGNVPGMLPEDSRNVPGTFRVGLEGIGGEGKGELLLSGKPDDAGVIPADNGTSTRKRRPAVGASADVLAVWTYWQRVMAHPKAVLDRRRADLIAARLAQGKTVADLEAAIRGCRRSPYHRGDNEHGTVYDGLELICRDAAHVEAMIARLEAARTATREHRWQERDGRWWATATHRAREGALLDMGPTTSAEWGTPAAAASLNSDMGGGA